MGIDIYLRWPNMTELEKKAQYTGFNIFKGCVGYLREAYHGAPYATKDFVKEAFEHDCQDSNCPDNECMGAYIPAKTLRERLDDALITVREREQCLYGASERDIERAQNSYIRFVELAEKKEAENNGDPCRVYASY